MRCSGRSAWSLAPIGPVKSLTPPNASGVASSENNRAARKTRQIELHPGCNSLMQVFVRDNDINSALRVLKKKMQREGTFREMKRRRSYEKPSERRVREKAEAVRRQRKALRKRMEREGY